MLAEGASPGSAAQAALAENDTLHSTIAVLEREKMTMSNELRELESTLINLTSSATMRDEQILTLEGELEDAKVAAIESADKCERMGNAVSALERRLTGVNAELEIARQDTATVKADAFDRDQATRKLYDIAMSRVVEESAAAAARADEASARVTELERRLAAMTDCEGCGVCADGTNDNNSDSSVR